MNELDGYPARATATRPLLGMTVLAVEDSRFACDALRLLCLRSGARIRRADCLRSASRHLQVYQPTVAIIDLGLPDGSGANLIAELDRASARVPAILGTSGDPFAEDVAIAAGADGFLPKPAPSLALFQSLVISALPKGLRPTGARMVTDEEIAADPIAYRDDMEHAAELLADMPDINDRLYVAHFIAGLARTAGDMPLLDAVTHWHSAGGEVALVRLREAVRSRVDDSLAI